MAVRPLRCLGLAVKEWPDLGQLNKLTNEEEAAASPYLRNPSQFAQIESNLVFLGIAGIKDPARPEAARAIVQCREAGVRVIMITGDSRETAIAIGALIFVCLFVVRCIYLSNHNTPQCIDRVHLSDSHHNPIQPNTRQQAAT